MTVYEQHIISIREQYFQKDYMYCQLDLARRFMKIHFAQAITIDEAAAAACFSKYHFLRLFKSVYNCTPHAYLTQIRIEKAKQLLREDTNIEEVCFSIGFISINSFKSLFKRYTRQTPNAYRQSKKINQTQQAYPLSPFLDYYKKSNFRVSRVKN